MDENTPYLPAMVKRIEYLPDSNIVVVHLVQGNTIKCTKDTLAFVLKALDDID